MNDASRPAEPPARATAAVAVENRYVEITQRLTKVTGAGAAIISLLTILSVWGRVYDIAWYVGTQVLLIAFNITINLRIHNRRGETARALINATAAALTAHCLGWPLPSWLLLPFVALAFDDFDREVARFNLVTFFAAMDAMSLVDRVPWIWPLVFTFGGYFCWHITWVRFGAFRDMVTSSDEQRRQLALAHDALKEEVGQRQRVELELHQAQKLESVGRLAAGVAHEINTPIQFVNDNVQFVREAVTELTGVIEAYQTLRHMCGDDPRYARAIAAEAAADLPFLLEQLPKALDSSVEGIERVASIVRSMKEFAHPDQKEMAPTDLNRAITSTLTIARNEYKYVADVETAFADLPLVTCHIGEINQVVLNLVVNAAHAIADVVKNSDRRGRITVRTTREGAIVAIAISDTGSGISASAREHVFEPFFTTKDVGRGTGQGLAIARNVIVEKHGGTLTFDTVVGAGTTFFVRLPIDGAKTKVAA